MAKARIAPKDRLPASGARRLWFAVVAFVLVPILLLVLLEAGLRLIGFGYPVSYLLSHKENGTKYLIENEKFGWRFFPRQLARNPGTVKFTAAKAPGTYRIFLFGESAALGDPRPAYSMGRYLEVLLQGRFPASRFEVITVAMTAINSHGLRVMARECARYDGDLWILYVGNNEMAGPFGVNPISGPAAPSCRAVRLGLLLRATRIGQLVEKITKPLLDEKKGAGQWEGIRMFREHQVAPFDPRKEIIYRNFERNLRDIVELGLSSGVQPLLCTVASNLRDFGPLASMDDKGLTSESQRTRDSLFRQGSELQSNFQFAEAAEVFRQALKIDPHHADLHFRLAQLALESSATNGPGEFVIARDYDALPFRADTKLNSIIREIAAQYARKGARLVDLETGPWVELPAQAPGDETFYDHVHFTFLGNYRAARAVAAQIEECLPAEITQKRAINWASAQLCERRLGLTDWSRRGAFEEMWQRQSEPPFTDQSNFTNRIQSLTRRIAEIREGLTTRAAAADRPIYEEAIAKNPGEFHIRKNFAEFLEATGSLKEAADQWISISQILPQDALARFHAGRIYGVLKTPDLAFSWLNKALAIRPNFPEAHVEIARVHQAQANYNEALRSCEHALETRPDDARALIQKAHALGALNRRDEAMAVLREAIRARPENWEPRYLLGIELAAINRVPEAMVEFQEVARLRPNYAQAHFNLAVALAKMGRLPEAMAEFQQTLALDPEHKLARQYLTALEESLAKKETEIP